MKNIIIISVLFLLSLSIPSFGIKVESLPLMSDFHIGVVNGIGNGINIGASALIPFGSLGAGLEIEQIMSDINYSASINATRFGLIASLKLSEILRVNYHMGNFNFMPSAAVHYKDADGGDYLLTESTNYKGQYFALSSDYRMWDYLFTLKFVNNSITGKGTVREIDLNVGRSI